MGVALALGAQFEAHLDLLPAEWLNLMAGVWLLAAPFVLGFRSPAVAMVNAVAVGTAVAALAVSAMSLDRELQRWWQDRAPRRGA